MILTVSVFLTALGFLAWGVGIALDMPGIATIGGVLVVGVGAMTMVDGLQTKSGQVEATNTTTNTTQVSYQYQPVQTLASFPLGMVLTLLGGVQTLRALDSASA